MSASARSVHVVVKYFFPVPAGIETNILETYSVLSKKGWRVVVHTSKDTLTKHSVLSGTETIRGISIVRYPWVWYGFWPKFSGEMNLLALHNCNIVPHIPLLGLILIKRLLRQQVPKVIVTPHGGFTPEWKTFPLMVRVCKLMIHKTLYAFLLNTAADSIRAVSKWEKEEMISYGIRPSLITVISNGIENMAFENPDQSVSRTWKARVTRLGKYLIQMGRIHPIKNFETTIRALPSLPTDINFVIAGPIGDERYKQNLIDLARDLGVSQRVKFVGIVRGAEKFYLLKQALAMVHMALWESYCNVVHEGMSQGLVCVVANNTALPLLIKEGVNGYCVETRDAEALATTLQRVLDPKAAKMMKAISKRNLSEVRTHSWDGVANRLNILYTEMTQSV